MSLSLRSYTFRSSHPFRNCSNLRTLRLVLINATNAEVFNTLLSSCPSLKVLVLNITCFYKTGGPLKIENNKLKLLHVLLNDNIGGLEVSSTSLDILVIEDTSFGKECFLLSSPKLQFTKNFSVTGRFAPHISYNISKEKSIVHEEFMNNISGGLCELIGDVDKSMSVNIDLMNRTEVERLRQVLGLWIHEMLALEITFKDNSNATNESWEKKLWEEDNDHNNVVAFPNAMFRVKTLWMTNFSGSEEEFAFASCLIKHGTVVDRMMIKTTSAFTASKKLEIEAAVDKLREHFLFRKILQAAKPSVPVVEEKKDRVGSLRGGIEFMELCGFEKMEGEEFLLLPRDKVDSAIINSAGTELSSAISNPFFGVL
ncbi:hypothetical protein Bca52824_006904 [Brassica carinata]|uniref:Uncharacterized protein n=1 Tax=Brassica carinata TaxID=52824 RepID=A0A8X7W6V1_BRACI|nr:hypothetical protein Bca52824_006904 [Brassica carinata]